MSSLGMYEEPNGFFCHSQVNVHVQVCKAFTVDMIHQYQPKTKLIKFFHGPPGLFIGSPY